MSALELVKKRYSVRQYEERPVEEEKLQKILEAGRVAPSAKNNQPSRLIVVREKESLAKLKKGANVYGAPLAIIVAGDHQAAWVRPYDNKNSVDIDASIVADHIILAATELGLGTLWVCYFDPVVIRQEFNLPAHIEPINILGVGYAAGEAKSPDRHNEARKPLNEIVVWESY
ncbi:MAG TPA: nitroreductase family protein [Methylomusa anaerophila]|uniref:FMN reductase [NAD(P)H] n=1 Tax=Methylomusa anaerophila TaxID=1930071 RepID=A0A348AEI5_9FIRM|nr:nitroreductase family protein [Methylomusa anaerophila]BBB89483.1 FMN reductase [NAD(P)H] [Methylomusa anaerophila]HML89714.1 nitroreductase family protein [Methylomusa anaerophila]